MGSQKLTTPYAAPPQRGESVEGFFVPVDTTPLGTVPTGTVPTDTPPRDAAPCDIVPLDGEPLTTAPAPAASSPLASAPDMLGSLAAIMPDETMWHHDQYQRWLSSLLRTTSAVSSTLSLKEVLYAVSREVIEAIGAFACNSSLFRERTKNGYYYIVDPAPPADYVAPDPPDNFALEALESGKPIACDDFMSDPRGIPETKERFHIASAMAFPLNYQGKAIAVGLAWFKDPHHFTKEEIEVVMAIANAGALAVANARLHQSTLELAVAQERNRLAQELHDCVCQDLASIKMELNTLLYSCRDSLSEDAVRRINEIKEHVDDSYEDTRDIIHSFRAASLQDDDFPASIRDYIATFEARYGLAVTNGIDDEHLALLSHKATLEVGRIVGEALSNIRKHAHAQNVWLKTADNGREVVITVEDDGTGFDLSGVNSTHRQHFGLAIMRERARIVGGRLSVAMRKPHGTTVIAVIPYR